MLKISGKTPIFSRRVLIPETFLIELEKAMTLRGPDAQKALYSAGKRFGYAYAILGGFMTVKDKQDQDLLNYIDLVNKQIAGTYAKNIDFNIDFTRNVCTYDLKNFVIIERLGFGYFLPLGSAAGLISYILQDKTIEGIVEESDVDNGTARLTYAPSKYLDEMGKRFFHESELTGLEPSLEYIKFNELRQLKYSDYSLKKLIDAGIFVLEDGILISNNERYFMIDSDGFYLLELGLKQYAKEVYYAAFTAGVRILGNVKNPQNKTIIDYLSAFGWGDVTIMEANKKYVINVDYFPYTKFYNDIDYGMFSGMLSGMISCVAKRKIGFKQIKKTISNGYLSVSLFE